MQNDSTRNLIYQLRDGTWLIKDKLKIFSSPIVACCWLNRERRYQGLEPLDVWESQLMHWEAIPLQFR